MNDFWLPKDLDRFLRDGLQLQYDRSFAEPGQVVLVEHVNLRLDTFGVFSIGKEQAFNDPNRGRSGHYAIPAVNLVSSSERRMPGGILLWVPTERNFGAWDCEQRDLWLFPKAIWYDIATNPLPYINAMWRSERVEKRWLVPWPKYPFVGDPDDDFGVNSHPREPRNPPFHGYSFPG
jgi:hypothetical protein